MNHLWNSCVKDFTKCWAVTWKFFNELYFLFYVRFLGMCELLLFVVDGQILYKGYRRGVGLYL